MLRNYVAPSMVCVLFDSEALMQLALNNSKQSTVVLTPENTTGDLWKDTEDAPATETEF